MRILNEKWTKDDLINIPEERIREIPDDYYRYLFSQYDWDGDLWYGEMIIFPKDKFESDQDKDFTNIAGNCPYEGHLIEYEIKYEIDEDEDGYHVPVDIQVIPVVTYFDGDGGSVKNGIYETEEGIKYSIDINTQRLNRLKRIAEYIVVEKLN